MMKSLYLLLASCLVAGASRSPTSSPTAAPTAAPTYGPSSAAVVAEIFTGVIFGMIGTVVLYVMWGRYSYDRDHERNIAKFKAAVAAGAAPQGSGRELEEAGADDRMTQVYQAGEEHRSLLVPADRSS